jgi:hypothetical protein
MTKYTNINSDNTDAPKSYFVRVDLGAEELKAGRKRFAYYENPTKISKLMGCSRNKVINFISGRRTISIDEWMNFNAPGK